MPGHLPQASDLRFCGMGWFRALTCAYVAAGGRWSVGAVFGADGALTEVVDAGSGSEFFGCAWA